MPDAEYRSVTSAMDRMRTVAAKEKYCDQTVVVAVSVAVEIDDSWQAG